MVGKLNNEHTSNHKNLILKSAINIGPSGAGWALNPPSSERLTHGVSQWELELGNINAPIYFELVGPPPCSCSNISSSRSSRSSSSSIRSSSRSIMIFVRNSLNSGFLTHGVSQWEQELGNINAPINFELSRSWTHKNLILKSVINIGPSGARWALNPPSSGRLTHAVSQWELDLGNIS